LKKKNKNLQKSPDIFISYDVFMTCNILCENSWGVLQYYEKFFFEIRILELYDIFQINVFWIGSPHAVLKLSSYAMHHWKGITEFHDIMESFFLKFEFRKSEITFFEKIQKSTRMSRYHLQLQSFSDTQYIIRKLL
jgi:hypothetical protein